MWTEFWHELRNNRGKILGWGLTLALLGGYLLSFYETISDQQEQLQQLIDMYPPELMAFFGGVDDMFTPAGFLHLEFFSYMPIVLGILAVLAGSGLFAADEEKGTLNLVLAHPISRTRLFWGRLLALVGVIVVILGVIWLAFVIANGSTEAMDFGAGELLLPMLTLLAVLLLFGTLGVLLSMFLPSRGLAAMMTGVLLVASFFITSLEQIDDRLEPFADLSPLTYYQGGRALEGFNGAWFAGLMIAALVFALLAWWRFERKDIRVAGEGGWALPWFGRRSRPAS
jgi:ABC-2 type transport system permease protein